MVVTGVAVRNNGTRNGWITQQCTDAEGKSARSLQAGREAFPSQGGLFLLSACCANNHLSLLLAHIQQHFQLGHAVKWPQLLVRRYLHTPTDALTLLGPNASPSCYSTNFYSGESYAYLIC